MFVVYSLRFYWAADGNSLDVKKGRSVFTFEGRAVSLNLTVLAAKDMNALAVPDLNAVNYLLLRADELLAKTALDQAKVAPVNDSRYQKKYAAAVKKAQSSFDAAFVSIDKKKLTTAIKQFGTAWVSAQNAIKYANKGVKQTLDEAKEMIVDIEDAEVEEDEA